MISALISLTDLTVASAADRRSRVRTAIALGDIPDLTEIIDARGLKVVADRVNTMSDGAPKEMMLRGIDRWLHRIVRVGSLEEGEKIAKKDWKAAAGARVMLFNTAITIGGGTTPSRGLVSEEYPVNVEILENAKTIIGTTIVYAFWHVRFLSKRLNLTEPNPEITGPTYLVKP